MTYQIKDQEKIIEINWTELKEKVCPNCKYFNGYTICEICILE